MHKYAYLYKRAGFRQWLGRLFDPATYEQLAQAQDDIARGHRNLSAATAMGKKHLGQISALEQGLKETRGALQEATSRKAKFREGYKRLLQEVQNRGEEINGLQSDLGDMTRSRNAWAGAVPIAAVGGAGGMAAIDGIREWLADRRARREAMA